MSISSEVRKAGPYACNGSTTAFPFAFKVFSAANVRVVLTDANGVESDLVLGTNYSVSTYADQDTYPGGAIATTVAYATGCFITLTSRVQNLQPVTLTNQGGFYPRVINNALDRLTILVQQVVEVLGRSLKVPYSASSADTTLPVPAPNKALKWNPTGTGFTNSQVDPDDVIGSAVEQVALATAQAQAAAASAGDAQTSADASADSATLANQWADQQTGVVADSEYSAKAYAVGLNEGDPPVGSAKSWASQLGAPVDVEYSAKEYAVGSPADGSAKSWATQLVTPVDGADYSAKHWAQQAAFVVSYGAYDIQTFTVAGNTLTLDRDPNGANALEVVVAGSSKTPNVDYTVTATTLVWINKPADSTTGFIRYLGRVANVVAVGLGIADRIGVADSFEVDSQHQYLFFDRLYCDGILMASGRVINL